MSGDAKEERTATRDRILDAALTHAAFDGWTKRTLLRAAADAGVDGGTAVMLFPRGGDSLIEWLDSWIDRQMLAAVSAEDLARLPIRRRVAVLVRSRLEALGPHREALRRALAAQSLPGNLWSGSRQLWRSVDAIWQAVGLPADMGFSWWSRRATLASVVAATTLFWLDDQSEDHEQTWAFLDRRIEDVMRIGKLGGQIGSFLERVPGFGPRQASGAQ